MTNRILLIHADEYVKIFCCTANELENCIMDKLNNAETDQAETYFWASLGKLAIYSKDFTTRIICFQHHGSVMPEHLCTVYPFFIDHGLAYAGNKEDAHWYCSYFIVREPDGRRDCIGHEIYIDAETNKEFIIDFQPGNIAHFSVVRTTGPYHKGVHCV